MEKQAEQSELVTILCGGPGLGFYVPGAVLARQLARRMVPEAAIYEAPNRVFADPSIDVVGLFTLADARPQQIRQALATGKHVLAEKPLGADVGTEWQLVREIEALYA